MNKDNTTRSFDFSYFVSVGGIGVLCAAAAVMMGVAAGEAEYGYYAGSFFLFVSAIYLGNLMRQAKSGTDYLSGSNPVSQSENNGIATIMTSVSDDIVFANKAANVLFDKYKLGDPISPLKLDISNKNTIKSLVESLATGQMKSAVAQIGDTEKYLRFEIEKIKKNGIFYSWRIIEDAQSEFSLNNIIDPENIAKLGRLFERSDIGLFAINQNEKITHINEILQKKLFGNSVAPALPMNLSQITPHTANNLKNIVEFKDRKGSSFFARVARWNSDAESDVKTFLVLPAEHIGSTVKDDTPQKDTENSFFRSSPIGIAVVHRSGKIKDKNVVFSNFIADLELEHNNELSDILTDENSTVVFKEIEKTIDIGKPSQMVELDFKGLSDKQGQFYITKSKDSGDDVVVYLIDTTEQKNLELQFSQSQKMQAVGQLAGGVAHDFNNLLTAITGFCDLLLVKHGPGDQSFSDIIQIKQNANRAANLVRQLLAFSRQQTLRPKVIIITDVVAELSNLLRRLIGSNIELKMNHGRDIEPVRVDQGQLEQVIINLCVNARDAMPDGGKLEIKTRNISEEESLKITERYQIFPKGEYVLLEVIDNGTGISKDHIGKVFEPFFSTKEVGKGTGLGLSTVYGIIKQTNGFVFPESELGVGTSFKIYLPKHIAVEGDDVDDADEKVKPDGPAQDLTGSSTILLVEDEDAVRMFASRALKNKGYTVYEADSGVSALNLLKETEAKIDLLISDVMMPQMDGPSLVKKIRETDKTLKVIFISGYAEDALDDNLMDKDFNFLSKPFSLKQLAEQVKEVLDK